MNCCCSGCRDNEQRLPGCLLLSPEGPQEDTATPRDPRGHGNISLFLAPCPSAAGRHTEFLVSSFPLTSSVCLVSTPVSNYQETEATLLGAFLPFSSTNSPKPASVLVILISDSGSFHEDLTVRWAWSDVFQIRILLVQPEKTAPGGMRFRLHRSEMVQQASFLQDCSEPLLATERYRLGHSPNTRGQDPHCVHTM